MICCSISICLRVSRSSPLQRLTCISLPFPFDIIRAFKITAGIEETSWSNFLTLELVFTICLFWITHWSNLDLLEKIRWMSFLRPNRTRHRCNFFSTSMTNKDVRIDDHDNMIQNVVWNLALVHHQRGDIVFSETDIASELYVPVSLIITLSDWGSKTLVMEGRWELPDSFRKTTYGFQISLDVKYYRLEPYSALRYWIISDRANRMRILRKEIH